MRIKHIYLGYWYQRTSLHLSEAYDFLTTGTSPLNLDKQKLKDLHARLEIAEVSLNVDVLEYIEMISKGGVTTKIYEDGLVILSLKYENIKADVAELTEYFEQRYSPAISYIFSLGAPVPKELTGLKSIAPCMIVASGATKERVAETFAEIGEDPYFDIEGESFKVFRGDRHYVISVKEDFKDSDELIASLIFFREFKSQLHRYLNIHRTIWEKISKVKEKQYIRGREVQALRNELESYKKTIELISGRIEQMGLYMEARSSIIKARGWEGVLADILDFKYQNLQSNLDYIESIWGMTSNYLDAAIQMFSEINAQSTKSSVEALTLISSIGVVSTVLDFLQTPKYPAFSQTGYVYFAILAVGTVIINRIIRSIYQSVKYRIEDVKAAKM